MDRKHGCVSSHGFDKYLASYLLLHDKQLFVNSGLKQLFIFACESVGWVSSSVDLDQSHSISFGLLVCRCQRAGWFRMALHTCLVVGLQSTGEMG